MALKATATAWVGIALFCSNPARGQPSGSIGVSDVDPAPAENLAPAETLAPAEAAAPRQMQLLPCASARHCCCPQREPDEASEAELRGVVIAGVTTAIVSYVFANVLATTQPRFQIVDGIPIIGAITSVAHNRLDDQRAPVLLFTAALQTAGLLLALASGIELRERRRLRVDVGASPWGAGVALTARY